MKVCSLYGAGFFYIPGTDTCIKIGGFLRTEWLHNSAGSFSTYLNGANAFAERDGNTLLNRSRGIMSFDVRSQTEYGTLRSYLRAGWQYTSLTDTRGGSSGTVYLDRAFIQLAGFTFGKTQSFFDTPAITSMTYQTTFFENTGGRGTPVFAYTAALGNGVTATLSLEDQAERVGNVVDVTENIWLPGANLVTSNAGNRIPDIVGNLRVDQAWGSAQISGALHNVAADYYNAASLLPASAHPDDKWGWAVGAGLNLRMPWNPKDTFVIAGAYGKGAVDYVINVGGGHFPNGTMWNRVNPGTIGAGWANDAYFSSLGAGSLELSEAWQVNAGFQHYWTPTLRQSIHGMYVNYESNSSAVDAQTCVGGINPALAILAPGCTDWSSWNVGSRLIWNPVANLDIGLEVLYSKMDQSAFDGQVVATNSPNGINTPLTAGDADVWSAVFRIQRNFWP